MCLQDEWFNPHVEALFSRRRLWNGWVWLILGLKSILFELLSSNGMNSSMVCLDPCVFAELLLEFSSPRPASQSPVAERCLLLTSTPCSISQIFIHCSIATDPSFSGVNQANRESIHNVCQRKIYNFQVMDMLTVGIKSRTITTHTKYICWPTLERELCIYMRAQTFSGLPEFFHLGWSPLFNFRTLRQAAAVFKFWVKVSNSVPRIITHTYSLGFSY